MKPRSTPLPLAALVLTALLSGIFTGAKYQQNSQTGPATAQTGPTAAAPAPSASASSPATEEQAAGTSGPAPEGGTTAQQDLWPELDRLLAELKAEEQAAAGQTGLANNAAPATASPGTAENAAAPSALPSLEPLIEASSATWLTSSLEQRLLNSLAMVKQIFKDQPERIQIEQVQALENCISAAAAESDLGELQVKELAAACALALNWR